MCSVRSCKWCFSFFFFFQAEDGIRDVAVTGVQTCALPILRCARNLSFPPRSHTLATMHWSFSPIGPTFVGKNVLRVALWTVLAYVLFRCWPAPAEGKLGPALGSRRATHFAGHHA